MIRDRYYFINDDFFLKLSIFGDKVKYKSLLLDTISNI